MQDRQAERAFYDDLFAKHPENEHITHGYDELHALAFGLARPSGYVLDLGCGTGAHAVRLARRGYGVIAVDLTRQGVKIARERLRRESLGGLFVVADAEHLPLRGAAVEVAWTALLLHHFRSLDEVLSELRRVVRRRVIAFEPNALNMLTWVAFNVINRTVGISGMTRNQKALTPFGLDRQFARVGFRRASLHYVGRGWSDSAATVRHLYSVVTTVLPERFRANKFLVIYEKGVV